VAASRRPNDWRFGLEGADVRAVTCRFGHLRSTVACSCWRIVSLSVMRQERHYIRCIFERAKPELAGAGLVL